MSRAAVAITLSEAERRELEGLARRRKTAQGLARRARIVLAAAEGLANKTIVERLGADANTVGKWRRRFAERRLDGLYDEPRCGAPRKIGDERIAEIIGRTLEETPPDGTHWSLRSMARAVGYAPSTIHRIWQAFGLQPHRSETFKLSSDPLFVEKVRDIVGLYLSPPERALVLCVDEKSQIQGEYPEFCALGHSDEKERSILWQSRRNYWTSCWRGVIRKRYSPRTVCLTS